MTQSEQLDLIIVTVYLICVFYVLYQAITSLDDRTKYDFDKKAFEQQLDDLKIEDTPLKELVSVGFKFDDRYKFPEQPKELAVSIDNKYDPKLNQPSDDPDNPRTPIPPLAVHAVWDSSTITDYDGRARRAAVQMPDNSWKQAPTIVPPGEKASAKVAPEENTVDPRGPIIDLDKLKKAAGGEKTPKNIKDLHANFLKMEGSIKFSLRLVLQFVSITEGKKKDYWHVLYCNFTVTKMPWTDYLPWIPKK